MLVDLPFECFYYEIRIKQGKVTCCPGCEWFSETSKFLDSKLKWVLLRMCNTYWSTKISRNDTCFVITLHRLRMWNANAKFYLFDAYQTSRLSLEKKKLSRLGIFFLSKRFYSYYGEKHKY